MDPDSRNAALKPTYKMVEARSNPYFGTVIRKAEGAKTVRPSDPRVVREQDKAYTTKDMEMQGIRNQTVYSPTDLARIQYYYRRKMKYYETF